MSELVWHGIRGTKSLAKNGRKEETIPPRLPPDKENNQQQAWNVSKEFGIYLHLDRLATRSPKPHRDSKVV